MKILLAASECEPYVKVGGLGDVVSSLAVALRKLGHDARIVLPKYGNINWVTECHAVGGPMIVNMGYGVEFAQLLETTYNDVTVYFIEFNKYFDRPAVYGEFGGSYDDNWQRFAFFSRAVLDMCAFLDWQPDVIHCNDWPTGIIPPLLSVYNKPDILNNTKSICTIHKMAHHGYAPKELLRFVGLYDHYWHPFAMEACNAINVMKGALQFADKITTVSSSYAKEIMTKEGGCGLDDVLRYRANDLIGICNGINDDIWSPEHDKFIPKNYSVRTLKNKSVCKKELQNMSGLPQRDELPIFAVISRFFWQKGLDVLCYVLPDILRDMAVQFVVLGSGEHDLEQRFLQISKSFPEKLFVKIGFDNALSHLIEAGSDFFVMPSRYEPCGLNQMYSMKYGTLPIVRATGGLIDTVENYDESTGNGTGFVFNDLTSSAIYNTIGWACYTFFNKKSQIKVMQKRGMKQDFSWRKSAKMYEKIYRAVV